MHVRLSIQSRIVEPGGLLLWVPALTNVKNLLCLAILRSFMCWFLHAMGPCVFDVIGA